MVNSGSEGTDAALAMARATTGADDVVSLRASYHGLSQGAMPVTNQGQYKQANRSYRNTGVVRVGYSTGLPLFCSG